MNNIKTARVKATGEVVSVYKLDNGTPTKHHVWHIYLADKLNMAAIESKEHNRTFTDNDLTFNPQPIHYYSSPS